MDGKTGGLSAFRYRARPAFRRKRQGVLAEGSHLDGQLPIVAVGAVAAFAVESAALSLPQPQTFAAFGSFVSAAHADGFGNCYRTVLSGHFLAPGAILRFGRFRSIKSSRKK